MSDARHLGPRPFCEPPAGSALAMFASTRPELAGYLKAVQIRKAAPHSGDKNAEKLARKEIADLEAAELEEADNFVFSSIAEQETKLRWQVLGEREAAGLTFDPRDPLQRRMLESCVWKIQTDTKKLWGHLTAQRKRRRGNPGSNSWLCLIALCEVVRLAEEEPCTSKRFRLAAKNLGPGIRAKQVRRAVLQALQVHTNAGRCDPDIPGISELLEGILEDAFRGMLNDWTLFQKTRAV